MGNKQHLNQTEKLRKCARLVSMKPTDDWIYHRNHICYMDNKRWIQYNPVAFRPQLRELIYQCDVKVWQDEKIGIWYAKREVAHLKGTVYWHKNEAQCVINCVTRDKRYEVTL